ncbi:MAG: hypothetical protein QQN63_00160 [Nitrosopumilus sp.]
MTDWIDREERSLREQRDKGHITDLEYEERVDDLWKEAETYDQPTNDFNFIGEERR